MHPPLHASRHPSCKAEIEALIRCHEEHPIAKYFNKCEDIAIALNKCFKQEKVVKRELNKQKIKAEKERLALRHQQDTERAARRAQREAEAAAAAAVVAEQQQPAFVASAPASQ